MLTITYTRSQETPQRLRDLPVGQLFQRKCKTPRALYMLIGWSSTEPPHKDRTMDCVNLSHSRVVPFHPNMEVELYEGSLQVWPKETKT